MPSILRSDKDYSRKITTFTRDERGRVTGMSTRIQLVRGHRYTALASIFGMRGVADEIAEDRVAKAPLDLVPLYDIPTGRKDRRQRDDKYSLVYPVPMYPFDWQRMYDAWNDLKGEPRKPIRYTPWGFTSMLSKVGKMFCRGFNLPAGPPELGGACPPSSPAFMYLTPEAQQRARRGLVPGVEVREEDFVCNGCYALKNNYGNANTILLMSLRMAITKKLLKRGDFVDAMVEIIGKRREGDIRRYEKGAREFHPNYFRIHDSGDFMTPEYAEAWIEIARRMPEIKFWAPTRAWALKKQSNVAFQHGYPENLTVRPSGLHFEEPPPEMVETSKNARVRLSLYNSGSQASAEVPASVWACPAYHPPERFGGGSGKNQGGCQLAHGPNSPARGGTEEREQPSRDGCRFCWVYKNSPVSYDPH